MMVGLVVGRKDNGRREASRAENIPALRDDVSRLFTLPTSSR